MSCWVNGLLFTTDGEKGNKHVRKGLPSKHEIYLSLRTKTKALLMQYLNDYIRQENDNMRTDATANH